jgi:hypothetical protein
VRSLVLPVEVQRGSYHLAGDAVIVPRRASYVLVQGVWHDKT